MGSWERRSCARSPTGFTRTSTLASSSGSFHFPNSAIWVEHGRVTKYAEQLGIDQGTLARYERGERSPVGKYLLLIERVLKYSGAVIPSIILKSSVLCRIIFMALYSEMVMVALFVPLQPPALTQ
jgi:transcriptional regulator with XRE-family HTH domain